AARTSTVGGSSPPVPSSTPSPSPRPSWRVVALGDSVTSGGPCGCTPFPELYGNDLAAVRGEHTHTANLGVGGQTSGGVLAALREASSPTARAVAAADIVLVTIGANDFADRHDDVTSGQCLGSPSGSCVADDLHGMERNVEAVVARVHALRVGRATAVLVTGYWNVFEDGAVARRAFPRIGVRATQRLTRLVDVGIRQAAGSAGATYVDLYAPFNGPASRGDTTRLLGPDGDHPNQAGQALIARRLVAAGLPGLVRG
ncbi:MAG: SGNH/GDSL hydrolase family protein, partial [Nocardioidaceae bacterium]